MARQPKRRFRRKTAKLGRRRKTANDMVKYSRVGARRTKYGENHGAAAKTTVSAKKDKSGRRRKTANDTVKYSRVGARRSRYGENHGAAAKTTVPAKNG